MSENPLGTRYSRAAIRSSAARIGGLSLHLTHDSDAIAARARAGLERKFEREADPDGSLSPDERERRVRLVKKRHYARLSLAAAKKRAEGSRPTRSRDSGTAA